MGGPLGPRDEAGEKAEQDGLVLIVSCEPIALLFCPAVINFEAFGYYHVILWHSWVSCLAFCLFWGGYGKGWERQLSWIIPIRPQTSSYFPP